MEVRYLESLILWIFENSKSKTTAIHGYNSRHCFHHIDHIFVQKFLGITKKKKGRRQKLWKKQEPRTNKEKKFPEKLSAKPIIEDNKYA